MIRLWSLLLLLVFPLGAQAVQGDKALHFGISFALGAGLSLKFEPLKACAISSGIGLAKELADSTGQEWFDSRPARGFSASDLAYDVAGSCAGAYLMHWWQNRSATEPPQESRESVQEPVRE